ncbi:M1 family aminopeptidase [uncultured Winogradskyella sp.]|uniref:M1 family aminopeptidase n=1 Tax=uncultured Winogradskyella sp. TaxID=395353 RepID=UPI002611B8E5|nr:M1 family aminopeptidase [uncultured Winogradskyella sp.]
MKRLITVFFLFLLSCNNDQENKVSYVVSTLIQDGTNLLKVNTTFHPNTSGETILLFQDKAWGQDSLHNIIKGIEVISEKSEITPNRDSGWYSIRHPKNLEKLEIEYTIRQDSEGELTTWDTYRPIIQEKYFHLFSHNFFMLPKHIVKDSEDNFDVVIQWKDFPTEYRLGNSFGTQEEYQEIKNTTEEKFHTAIFTGGDFRHHNIKIKGNEVNFIVRGDWQVFDDSTMVAIIDKTVSAQRDFWKDHSQSFYAITLIPTILERGSSFQGSGLTNSFATNASNNKFLDVEGLVYLFNHELQHNWTGSLIKNDDEEKQYWFSEGFTEYYTLKNIAKAKVYNLDESYFIKKFNEFVRELFTSPVNEMPNSELNYETFWSGKEGVQKLPYRRGAVFAFYLDNKIKKDTNGEKSLDDLLLNFKEDALKNGQKINHEYFIKTANKYLKEDLKQFFSKHIEEGRLFSLEEIYQTFGFEFSSKTKVYDLGFNFSEDKSRISSIDINSEAYKSGLREGDVFKSISYFSNSTEYKAEFTVIRNKKEIEISYYPTKEINLPQLKDNIHNKSQLNF